MPTKRSALLYSELWKRLYRVKLSSAASTVVYSFIPRRVINEYTTASRVINEYTTGHCIKQKSNFWVSRTAAKADACTYELLQVCTLLKRTFGTYIRNSKILPPHLYLDFLRKLGPTLLCLLNRFDSILNGARPFGPRYVSLLTRLKILEKNILKWVLFEFTRLSSCANLIFYF